MSQFVLMSERNERRRCHGEPTRFDGSLEDLERAAASTGVPVLMKDFVVHEAQICEAAHLGASAVLLIVRCLSHEQLLTLSRAASANQGPWTAMGDRALEDAQRPALPHAGRLSDWISPTTRWSTLSQSCAIPTCPTAGSFEPTRTTANAYRYSLSAPHCYAPSSPDCSGRHQ